MVEGAAISDHEGKPVCVGISQRMFHLFALSLDQGPNFDGEELSWWMSANQRATGMIYGTPAGFGFIVMRRRVDSCWVPKCDRDGLASYELAVDGMCDAMAFGEPYEPIPPGARRRPPLFSQTSRGTFRVLVDGYAHLPAMVAVGEVYLALSNPDANFASDMRGDNFDARIWELYLFACFREQGIKVTQAHPSPDFHIQRDGMSAYIEAVTAHSAEGSSQMSATPMFAPEDREERLIGPAAARFAKTIRSKLQRSYDELPHVAGHPFALAVADFHGSASMVWTREALPSYLYGIYPIVADTPSGRVAIEERIAQLRGPDRIPAGIFRDPSYAHLSAIVFSNAGTMTKFNRMGFLAGIRPPGLGMMRRGVIYDRTPGALEAIEFKADILSDEYTALWHGGECWCQELEIYHNPLATNPFPHDLLPGATHWFERDGELVCEAYWENTFVASVTTLNGNRPTPKLRQAKDGEGQGGNGDD
ncbi:MAG: hypothetical protein JNJ62_05130 [Pseudoxanthomonas mexicana]|nr:hypothetical protein [Pseudoxanthomonas mexicana]